MNCKNPNCNNEIARGKWCSDKCRMAVTRTKCSPKPEQIKGEQPNPNRSGTHPVTHLEHLQFYRDNPDQYATRTNPDKLNWGPHMDCFELRAAGFVANRVTIPGDWDYIKPEHTSTKYKGKSTTVQDKWDRHAVQGRPTVYSGVGV